MKFNDSAFYLAEGTDTTPVFPAAKPGGTRCCYHYRHRYRDHDFDHDFNHDHVAVNSGGIENALLITSEMRKDEPNTRNQMESV